MALINPKSEFVPSGGSGSTGEESDFRIKIDINPRAISGGKNKPNPIRLYPGMKITVRFDR